MNLAFHIIICCCELCCMMEPLISAYRENPIDFKVSLPNAREPYPQLFLFNDIKLLSVSVCRKVLRYPLFLILLNVFSDFIIRNAKILVTTGTKVKHVMSPLPANLCVTRRVYSSIQSLRSKLNWHHCV